MTKEIIGQKIDTAMYISLILFWATLFFDVPVNFLVVTFALGIIKLFFVRPQRIILSKHFYFVALFLGLIFISMLFNHGGIDFHRSFSEFKSNYISPLVALFLVLLFKFTRKRIMVMLTIVSAFLFINGFYIIWQHFTITMFRPIGFCTNTMLLGIIDMMIIPILLNLILTDKVHGWLKYLYLSTIIVNIPAIIFTATRIVWIGLALSTVIMLFMFIKNKKKLLAILIILGIAITGIFMSSAKLEKRFEVITDHSMKLHDYTNAPNTERIVMWTKSIEMISDYPVFGVGVGNFHDQFLKYKPSTYKGDPWHPHNVFFSIADESGLVGFIGFIALFIYLYYNVIKQWYSTRSIVVSAYFFALFTYNVSFLTDTLFGGHYIKLPTYMFWFITAAYLALSKQIYIKEKEV